ALAVAVVLLARLPAVLRLSGVAASGGFRLWRRGFVRRGRRGRFGGWRCWRAVRRGGLGGLGGLAYARLAHARFGGVAGVVGVVGQVRNPRMLRTPWTGRKKSDRRRLQKDAAPGKESDESKLAPRMTAAKAPARREYMLRQRPLAAAKRLRAT